MLFIVLFIGYLVLGENFELKTATKTQAIEFILLILILIMIIFIIIFFTFKGRKSTDDYIDTLIDKKNIRCSRFSDELLSSVCNAYLYIIDNHKTINPKEKCGCIHCLKIFCSSELKNFTHDKSVTCPYCNTANVITESSGYPIDTDFLSAMKEYWIDLN